MHDAILVGKTMRFVRDKCKRLASQRKHLAGAGEQNKGYSI